MDSAAVAILGLSLPGSGAAQLTVESARSTISFPAVVQAEAFASSTGPDDRYHAVVFRGGDAAAKALFVAEVSDVDVARALRQLGADDGGGVPMAAWTLRRLPLIPHPSSHVLGTQTEVTVHWEGSGAEYHLHDLVMDEGGHGVHTHFGGNEEHDHTWPSGCIICFFSCPGGVLSNAAYSIRDHVRGATDFTPGDDLPPDGTPVTITLTLVPG